MTAVSDIINSALRETNLIPLGVAPTAAQQTEAFNLLSTIVAGVLGNEAGENLQSFPLGRDNITAPQGYPWWANELPTNVYIPSNYRIMCNLTDPGQVNFDPRPQDGARMGVVDCSDNFDLNPLTLNGNGRLIDGNTTLILSVASLTQQWVYRDDIGSWVTVIPLALEGQMPWPPEFDDMFIILLATRLNPRYGQVMHPASVEILKIATTKFSSRYKQSSTQVPVDAGLIRMTNEIRLRGLYQIGDAANFLNGVGMPVFDAS